MKLLNKNACLKLKRIQLLTIVSLMLSTLVIASVYKTTSVIEEIAEDGAEPWIPTAEDIAYQDSMFAIIKRTQHDLDTIKAGIDNILYKLERFEYPDGTYDSIRYVVGGKVDIRRNKR